MLPQVGRVFGNRYSQDEDRTLASLNFETGDFFDVVVYTNGRR